MSRLTLHKSRWLYVVIGIIMLGTLTFVLARPIVRQYHLWRARQAIADRQPKQALQWLDAAQSIGGEGGDLYYVRARAFRHLEAYDKFVENLRQADRFGFPVARLDREKLLAMIEAAEVPADDPEVYKLLAQPGGDSRELYEALVKGYYRRYQLGPALLVLESWQADFPDDPQPRLYRGRLSEFNDDWAASESWFQEAVELAPTRADLRLNLARAKRKQQRYRAALVDYLWVLARQDDVEALHGLGRCLYAEGRVSAARDAFAKGLAVKPDDDDCLLAMGELELETGQFESAVRWLEQAAERKPREYDVRYALAKALLGAGRGDEAKSHFQFAVDARRELNRVQVLRDYVARHPDDVQRRYEIGAAMLKYGDTREALDWLQSVLHDQPEHRATREALADFFAQHGDDDAVQRHHQALTAGE